MAADDKQSTASAQHVAHAPEAASGKPTTASSAFDAVATANNAAAVLR